MNPQLSVVMSVYNGEKYLCFAIDSILNQTFKDFEFIMIDDGSTDNSAEIIKSYDDSRIILIKQENRGLAAALNEGIKIAKGKYIARMDADDISAPNRFAMQLQHMEENSSCVVVGSLSNIISKDGDFLYLGERITDNKKLKNVLPYNTPFAHGSSFIRTSALRTVNGYKNEMRFSQDVLLWIDLAEVGDFAIIPQPLYDFRVTPFSNQRKSKKYIEIQSEITYEYFKTRILNLEKINQLPIIGGGLTEKQKMAAYYMGIGIIYLSKQVDKTSAKYNLLKSLKYDSLSFKVYAYLLLSIFPQSIINYLRNLKMKRN